MERIKRILVVKNSDGEELDNKSRGRILVIVKRETKTG